MRHGTTSRRSRNRGGNGGNQRRNGNNRMQVFDSNGPDVRIRGTAHQINEKYVALARDASGSGDLILAESYLQYAEHYQRIINSWAEADNKQRAVSTPAQQEPVTEATTTKTTKVAAPDDELALPRSILGDGPISQKEKDVQLEDA